MDKKTLEQKASAIKQDIIRMIYTAGSGHPGGSLSCADILTVLFFDEMNIDPKKPKMKNRDQFVISKGHAAPALYAALIERGFLKKEELLSLRKEGSQLQGHPSMKYCDAIDMSTGSLAQGISNSVGIAMAHKMDKNPGRVYCVVGDGELQEGLVWEAVMSAGHFKLSNFCVFVDNNGLQIDGTNDEVMTVEPIGDKFTAFGFNVIRCDGHDVMSIKKALASAKKCKDKPTCIIAKTHKGNGVSFMCDNAAWHGKAPNKEQAEKAMKELGGEL